MALAGHAGPRPERLSHIYAQGLSTGNEKTRAVFPMLSPAVFRTMSEVERAVLYRVARLSPPVACSRLPADLTSPGATDGNRLRDRPDGFCRCHWVELVFDRGRTVGAG